MASTTSSLLFFFGAFQLLLIFIFSLQAPVLQAAPIGAGSQQVVCVNVCVCTGNPITSVNCSSLGLTSFNASFILSNASSTISSIYASNNSLTVFPNLSSLNSSSLVLDFSTNPFDSISINHIPKSVSQLILRAANVTVLPDFSSLTNLRTLDLSRNVISADFSASLLPPNASSLIFASNQLTAVPNVINETSLSTLDVTFNGISTFDESRYPTAACNTPGCTGPLMVGNLLQCSWNGQQYDCSCGSGFYLSVTNSAVNNKKHLYTCLEDRQSSTSKGKHVVIGVGIAVAALFAIFFIIPCFGPGKNKNRSGYSTINE